MSATPETLPLDGPFGVEVLGVDRRRPLGPGLRDAIAELFHRHLALLFRGNALTPREYLAFVRQFGEPDDSPPLHAPLDVDGFKGLRLVSNIVEGGRAIGQFGNAEMGWHQDRWTDAEPPPCTILYGAEIPARGGATSIASLAGAYEALPEQLRKSVEGRTIHFPVRVRDPEGPLADADIHDPAVYCWAPLVQTHAVTGRRFLYLGARRIQDDLKTSPRLSGLDREGSDALLDELFEALEGASVVYSHRWRPGDLLMWDNRACAHRREAFDNAERRLLYGSPLVRSDVLWTSSGAETVHAGA
jgi:taurine dioxygenase